MPSKAYQSWRPHLRPVLPTLKLVTWQMGHVSSNGKASVCASGADAELTSGSSGVVCTEVTEVVAAALVCTRPHKLRIHLHLARMCKCMTLYYLVHTATLPRRAVTGALQASGRSWLKACLGERLVLRAARLMVA